MPRLTTRLPEMKPHKASGQAVVWFGGQCHYLGKFGSPEAREKYDRLMAEWIRNRREAAAPARPTLSIAELAARYMRHADDYYRDARSRPTGEADNMLHACRTLVRLFGSRPAAGFGPKDLVTVRSAMVQAGIARTTINARINRIRRMFGWGVAEEIVPVGVFQALKTVHGLQKHRTNAREAARIVPVAADQMERTLPHLHPIVAAMVRVQFFTGCRPTEVAIMRPRDIDRAGDVWEYRPDWHKTEHKDRHRVIMIGPRAQEVLRPLLEQTGPDSYLFDPRKVVADIRRGRKGGRPEARTAPRYDRRTYRQAIVRACDRAFPHPTLAGVGPKSLTEEQRRELKEWRKRHRWSPQRLRKAQATAIRQKYGVEGSQVILGHARADVTQVYAERDLEKAKGIAGEIG